MQNSFGEFGKIELMNCEVFKIDLFLWCIFKCLGLQNFRCFVVALIYKFYPKFMTSSFLGNVRIHHSNWTQLLIFKDPLKCLDWYTVSRQVGTTISYKSSWIKDFKTLEWWKKKTLIFLSLPKIFYLFFLSTLR